MFGFFALGRCSKGEPVWYSSRRMRQVGQRAPHRSSSKAQANLPDQAPTPAPVASPVARAVAEALAERAPESTRQRLGFPSFRWPRIGLPLAELRPLEVLADPRFARPAVSAALAGFAFFSGVSDGLAVPPGAPLAGGPETAQAIDPRQAAWEQRPHLSMGARGQAVEVLQTQLRELDYPVGRVDGGFGRNTRRALSAFQRVNGLPVVGVTTEATWMVLSSGRAKPMPALVRYAPHAADTIALFERAAPLAGVPASWARSPGLHRILARESDGVVGQPNYTYGDRRLDRSRWAEIHAELRAGRITARSSATGLGQLLLSNVDRHYPSGRRGIGDPLEEAAGMLSYIKERYGTPERAWQLYGVNHEGY